MMIRKAAQRVYDTEKYRSRGELGELLLHIALQEAFATEPVVSKIYFKDAANDTVKGFDSVHVIDTPEGLELWLGEAKLYTDADAALRDAAASLIEHIGSDYLRREFALVADKVDPAWPGRERLLDLLNHRKSLDDVFKVLVLPALVTYDSPTIERHKSGDEPYPAEFVAEVRALRDKFAAMKLPPLTVHLIPVPLHSKNGLADAFHKELRAWQGPRFTNE